MKRIAILVGALIAMPVLFVIGLSPAESILTSGNPDSYILIGVGRLAIWVSGACEFIIGAAVATAVCLLMRKTRVTEQLPESYFRKSNTTS